MIESSSFKPEAMKSSDSPELTAGELIKQRNQAIDAILDPGQRIPIVTLVDLFVRTDYDSPGGGNDTHNFLVFAGGEKGENRIGFAMIEEPYGSYIDRFGAITLVEAIEISTPEYKGKGYGKAIYKELLHRLPLGFELACDPRNVSPSAVKIWQWLETNGLATHPEVPLERNLAGGFENLGYQTILNELTLNPTMTV